MAMFSPIECFYCKCLIHKGIFPSFSISSVFDLSNVVKIENGE